MNRARTLVPLVVVLILAAAVGSWGAVFISATFGPPVLPVYVQPPSPGPGYLWTPGYWAWSSNFDNYYWVPGTWVMAPEPGLLWTPGYWGFSSGSYFWHSGYWGPVVGFYGGINYGWGYPGHGYYGGYWRGHDFYYNRAVNNINVTNVHYVYNQPVRTVTTSRVAYNGGPGGIQARATAEQAAAERQRHLDPTPAQLQHEQAARRDPAQFAGRNQGRPAVVATPRPGALTAGKAVHASLPAANRPAHTATATHVQAAQRPPQNNQQARGPQNVPNPNNNARQTAPAPRVNNAPRQEATQHVAPPPRPEPQVQARQNHPPQPAPQQRAVTRPAPNMTPRPPQPHQAEPPRQSAAHHPPAPRGKDVVRP